MRSKVGIREVAKAAGVSVTTVSHALNDVHGARVSEDTRQRVQAAASALNYAPNRLASGLRNLQSQTIGFISDEISTTPFAGKMILGAQHAAKKHNLLLIMINTDGDAETEAQGIRALLQHQVDGIVYATMYHRRVQLPDALRNVPSVLLDAAAPEARTPSVVPDEIGGAIAAMHELLSAGHRRIGFVTNQDPIPATAGRLEGVKAALAEFGVPFDPSLTVATESTTDGGYVAAMRLLTPPERPTALFCFNDQMAMGAYRAAAELGLNIPTELSVVGFDNLELISGFLHPPLTTVQLPHYEMGVWAINQLEKEIVLARDDSHEPLRAKLECPIVRRASVAPPPLQ